MNDVQARGPRGEGALVVLYFLVYLLYLSWTLEGELRHWLSLVALPLAILLLLGRMRDPAYSLPAALASTGLRRGNLTRGLWIAALLGIALGALQLAISSHGAEILSLVRSGKVTFLYPLALATMLLTAAATEEFFFRGVLQTRLGALLRSRAAAVVVASLCFGLYHLPYAYFHPRWPSHGDLGAALIASFGQGVPGGLVLGSLFEGTRRNLLACILLHGMINAAPAMTMIRFG